MKNILILADGKTAYNFLARANEIDLSKKRFLVVYYDDKSIPEDLNEQFLLYKFDPTSTIKLKSLLNSHEFYQAIIVLANKTDALASYENIKESQKELPIVFYDEWQIELNDAYTTVIDVKDILSNVIVNHLPDIPLYARNIGLERGEIVEIKIPFGSPFTYRYISNIEQNRWKIVAIYRNQKLIIPDYNSTIEPNDSIIAIGNPNVLKSVYKSIHREFGQFPAPFGENIYCYIDMATMEDNDIEKITNDAMVLHSNINSQNLLFRVVNPRYGKALNKLKSYDKGSMRVELDFHSDDKDSVIKADVSKYQIGTLICNQDLFEDSIELFGSLNIPILKCGKSSFFNIKESAILSNDSSKIEKISSTIFDLSSQLKLDISIYEFEGGDSEEFSRVVEHFNNLAKLFEEKVKVIKTRRNPLRELNERDDLLQFLPFDKNIEKRSIFAFFTKNINRLHFQLSKNFQLFLPSDE